MTTHTYLSLFCGLGGLSLGFQRQGFGCVGAFDFNNEACKDHLYLTGHPATPVDLAAITPEQLRRRCGERRPDVVATSPPCKSFSGCLPAQTAMTAKYQAMSNLAYRGIWLALEAWKDAPPPLFVMENVPRIQSRGRQWLDELQELFRSYGYACRETTHDCGELGGLAQSRQRFLLVARHQRQTPQWMYVPEKYPLRGIGEVIGGLPIPLPGCNRGGPMHELTRLSALNWLRLALIPAGGDWRDIPESVGLSCEPRATAYGVERWEASSGTVVGAACHDNGGFSIADPRIDYSPRSGTLRVHREDLPAGTVIGEARSNKGFNVADGRIARPTHSVTADSQGELLVSGPSLDLEAQGSADPVPIIRAEDGTWHRPMTTLELAALQGLPVKVDGEWLSLAGGSKKRHRQRIGNAVPPAAAEAIAKECKAVLEAAQDGGIVLSSRPVWVDSDRQVPA